jgi:hypothetical protein
MSGGLNIDPPHLGHTAVIRKIETRRAVEAYCVVRQEMKYMIVSASRITAVGIWLGWQLLPVVADSPPTLKIASSCAAASTVGLGRNKQMCLDSEQTAQTQLAKNWPQYSSGTKTQCITMATHGGAQSYVELLTCLDTMTEAGAVRKAEGGEGANSETADRKPVRSISKQRGKKASTPSTAQSRAGPPTTANPAASNSSGGNLLDRIVRSVSGIFGKK